MSETRAETLTLQINGKTYHLRCPKDRQSELFNAANYLDNRMREISDNGQVRGTERVAVLAALNLAHELLISKEKSNEYTSSLGQRIKGLQKKIENSLSLSAHMEL